MGIWQGDKRKGNTESLLIVESVEHPQYFQLKLSVWYIQESGIVDQHVMVRYTIRSAMNYMRLLHGLQCPLCVCMLCMCDSALKWSISK